MDVPLPDSVQEKLARLQTGITGLSENDTRQALGAALGDGYAARFEAFEYKPFAAASIGQVHRARFEGQDIAFKLQYPQIARSFQRDLGAMSKIASLASLASAVDGKALVAELGARLAEECDYEREARFQSRFARAFEGRGGIDVPQVVDVLTTPTSLATLWAPGVPFSQAQKGSQGERDEMARNLVVFSYRSLLSLAAIQADPHPGNFLFGPGSRVTFLDFGCVRVFSTEFVQILRRMIQAIDARDHEAFRQSVIDLGLAPRPQKFNFAHHFEMMEHLHRPLLSSRFEFTREFVQQGLAYNGPASPNARHLSMPPEYIWVARLQWGLWSLLTRLGAKVELRDIYDSIISDPVTPLE
jgi:predicted unusual protein kinase regulating ubiquinone biosynthesis (AarF/ABC1/UbiB family)